MDNIKKKFKIENKYLERTLTYLIIFLLSFLIMTITFVFSSATWDMPMFTSYFSSPKLLLMNLLPILLLMIILYLIINRLWISFLITGALFISMSIVNRFKLTYRDEPFWFMDIKLIRESMEMTNTYSIRFTPNMIIMVIGVILITLILKVLFDYRTSSKRQG